jgi:hypothetical protein
MKYATHLPTSEATTTFNAIIQHDPVLLSFLETGSFTRQAHFQHEPYYQDPAFLQFIAPYFEPVFTATVIECLQTKDLERMTDLMANPILLDSLHEEKSYRAILQVLHEKSSRLLSLRNQLQMGNNISTTALQEDTDLTALYLLNELPDEFHSFRVEYCKELLQTARLLGKRYPNLALTLLTDIHLLHCDEKLLLQADHMLYELQSREIPAEEKTRSRSSVSTLLRAILVLSHK